MAQVPTLTQSEVALKPTPIDPKSAATLGEEVIDVGEGLSSLGDQMAKVRDATQTTQQLSGLSDDFNAIHNQAATDKNVWDAPQRYSEALEKAAIDRSKNITGIEAREKYLEQATRLADTRSTAINNMLMQKQSQEAKFTLTNAGGKFIRDYANSANAGERAMLKADFHSTVGKFKGLGIVGEEQGNYYQSRYDYMAEVATAKQDATKLDPERTLQELDNMEAGKPSIYPKFNPKDTEEVRTLAERQMKFNAAQMERNKANIQERNARDIDYMFRTNAPNLLQHVEEKFYTGQINQKTFDTYSKALSVPVRNPSGQMVRSGKVTSDGTDSASYTEALSYIADPKTSIQDVRNFIMEKYNTNKLSRTDRDKLYDLAIRPQGKDYKSVNDIIGLEQSNADGNDKFKRAINGSLDYIYNNVPGLKKFMPESKFESKFGQKDAENIDEVKAARMAKEFVKKISEDGVEPKDFPRIANDIINESRLIDRPEIAGYGEDGQLEQDENGVQSITSNNGATQQVDDDTEYRDPS